MLRTGAQGRYAVILRDLQMPVPVELGQFVAGLDRQRRRPILLRPFSSGPEGPCGAVDRHRRCRLYLPRGRTTPFHATHIALHEIAHMLPGDQHTAVREQLISLLAPDVDQALIRLILGRSAYSTTEEREAETLASLILSSAARS